MDLLFKKALIRLYLKFKNLKRYEYLKKLEKRNSMDTSELKQIQLAKLKKLVDHCYKNVPYYTKRFDEHNIKPTDIKSLEDFKKVPILTKKDIKNNYYDLIDKNLCEKTMIHDTTSGSTGVPLFFSRSMDNQEFGFALRYRSNAWCGWDFFDKTAWFVSDARRISEINRIKGRLRLWLLRRLVFDTKKNTESDMMKWANQLQKFKPKQIYGYSSLLLIFAKFIIKNNIKITGVQGVFSTSEVLREREIIAQAFNAPVYDQYGSSEVPCIAHECKKGKMHINIDEVLVEFEDIDSDNPSDIKKIICTPLYLNSMPLLRYELQDASTQIEQKCDCGLPFPVMELKIGRQSDNITTPSGKIISAVTLSWYITECTENLEQYKIIQNTRDDFYIELVCEEKDRDFNVTSIKALLYEMLGTDKINIKFKFVEKIAPLPNGKYRAISSSVV